MAVSGTAHPLMLQPLLRTSGSGPLLSDGGPEQALPHSNKDEDYHRKSFTSGESRETLAAASVSAVIIQQGQSPASQRLFNGVRVLPVKFVLLEYVGCSSYLSQD